MRASFRAVFLAGAWLAVGTFSAAVDAATFTVFGPKDYPRLTGKPTTASDGFSVLNPGTFYFVHVYNGGKGGQFPERASSAVVGVNGVEIVGPSEFSQQVWHIERPVTLTQNNELTVEIRSKPGSGVTIEIVGIDNDPPTIVAVVSPPPNAAGWNRSDVTVSFECADAASGIAFCSSPVAITGEGAGQSVTGTAIDRVGFSASVSVTVNLDKTAPTIAAKLSEPPNAAGWHAAEVTVSFECGDVLSGVQSCPSPILVGEGAAQVISGTAVDLAGNTAGASVTLNVDTTPPTIQASLDPSPNPAGWNRTDVTVSFECSDATSGIASCSGPVQVNSEGLGQAVPGTATDRAGHSASMSAVVNLDKTPPDLAVSKDEQLGEPALEVLYINEFEFVWKTLDLDHNHDNPWYPKPPLYGSFYRALPPAGYSVLGYYGQSDYDPPDGFVAVARELTPGALAAPVRYDAIWSSLSTEWNPGAFWRPIPLDGYACPGVVVTPGFDAPSLGAVRCVRSDLVVPGKALMQIWTNEEAKLEGRLRDGDLGTWILAPSDGGGVHLGLLAAQSYSVGGGYAPPTSGLWVLDRRKVRGSGFPLHGRALEVRYIDQFDLAWNDRGSGANRDGAFYRPLPPTGFSVIGYYGQAGYDRPGGKVAVVKELIAGALAAPVAYQEVWRDVGSGAYLDGAFWRPIPPDGYTCLGLVVTFGYSPPTLDAIRCVRTELTAPASFDRSLWDTLGSDAHRAFKAWHIVPASGGVYLGAFDARAWGFDFGEGFSNLYNTDWWQAVYTLREEAVTADTWVTGPASSFNGVATDALSGLDAVSCNGAHAPVDSSTFVCSVPVDGQTTVTIVATDVAGNEAVFTETAISASDALDVTYATSFEWMWDDSGSGASDDGAFYRPIPPVGFSALGHYGQGDYGTPVGVVLAARERTSGALAAPVGYEFIWFDVGSGATDDGGFWWPMPPPGYQCLGVVASRGWSVPPLDEVGCVRKEFAVPGSIGSEIWNDIKSGSDRDFAAWQIVPGAGTGLHTGAFAARSYPRGQGYAKPTRPVWVLAAGTVVGSAPLGGEAVGALIAANAPVLRLYPGEPYLPDDPGQILDAAKLQWALVRNEGAYCSPGWPPEMCRAWGGQSFDNLDEMTTSAATLMANVAQIESEVKPNPPYSNGPDFRLWLSIPDALIHGDLTRAKPVVHVRPRGPFTEIQFWYFYPFNGPGRVRICWEHCETEWFNEAGRHYGDWEMVSLLVENATGSTVAAGLSQHGSIEWVQYAQLEKHTDGVRPLVYPALHSHANYRQQGTHYYEVVFNSGPIMAKTYDLTGAGQLFEMGDYYLASDEPSVSPDWLLFPYRWGQYIWNHDDVYFLSTNYYDQNEVNPGPTGPAMKPEW